MARRGQRGVSAVEFALILPLLVILLFGIVEFSLILYNKQVITNASREGARFGIVYSSIRPTQAQIRTVVNNYCNGKLISFKPSAVSVDFTCRPDLGDPATCAPPPCGADRNPIVVSVTYRYDFLALPAFVESLLGSLNLNARTLMNCE